ncbi:MAG: hypothetical protein ACTSV2_09965 [Candidatus Thorarchaeota archaeon]
MATQLLERCTYPESMSIPEQLKIGEDLISISLDEDVGVYDTGDYVLIEISHKAGKIYIPKIAQTVYDLVRRERKMVAIRGYGFKGIGLGVRIAHEIKMLETRFKYQMVFDTFDAFEANNDRPVTSMQVVIMPPEKES